MSKMSELHQDLETIRAIMAEPEQTAEVQIERRVDFLVRELDELCLMANNPETRDLIANEAIGIGQVQFRASLILSFLNAEPKLRVVR